MQTGLSGIVRVLDNGDNGLLRGEPVLSDLIL